jgi:hypothetical protein
MKNLCGWVKADVLSAPLHHPSIQNDAVTARVAVAVDGRHVDGVPDMSDIFDSHDVVIM